MTGFEMTPAIQVTVTAIIGLGTLVGVWYQLNATRSNIESDTASKLVGSAGEWVDRLDARVEILENELEQVRAENHRIGGELRQVRAENARYRAWAKLLVAQVVENGGNPIAFEDVPLP